MTVIKKGQYEFHVDVENTKEYYRTHDLCGCENCQNYYVQALQAFPKLADFLGEFGVDIARPDEAMSIETGNSICYIQVDYTVCGNIPSDKECELEIVDGLPLKITAGNGFSSPNSQTGEYFTISVMDIELPWVLEVPISQSVGPQYKKGNDSRMSLLARIFGKPKKTK